MRDCDINKLQSVYYRLLNSKRFYRIETENQYWFYDSYSHSLYSIQKNIFDSFSGNAKSFKELLSDYLLNEITKILNFFMNISRTTEDWLPEYHKDRKLFRNRFDWMQDKKVFGRKVLKAAGIYARA